MIGIDIGYGDVKAVFEDGGEIKYIKFPNAIAYAREGIIGDLINEQEVEYQGIGYIVGEDALKSQEIFSTRSLDFLFEYSPLLIWMTIKKASKHFNRLCLGVPLAYYSRRDELKRKVERFVVSEEEFAFEEVEVRAQGQGVYLDYSLSLKGEIDEEKTSETLLVVDVGFNTIDVLAVVDGRPQREWSDMLENAGVCRICQELRGYLMREFSLDLSEQAIKDLVMKGSIRIYGAEKDLSVPLRSALKNYTSWLRQEIQSRWDGFLKGADRMIVAGGGSYYLEGLKDLYPDGFVHIPEKGEFSNARGFFKFLKAKIHS